MPTLDQCFSVGGNPEEGMSSFNSCCSMVVGCPDECLSFSGRSFGSQSCQYSDKDLARPFLAAVLTCKSSPISAAAVGEFLSRLRELGGNCGTGFDTSFRLRSDQQGSSYEEMTFKEDFWTRGRKNIFSRRDLSLL
jgi:hypothetical protein